MTFAYMDLVCLHTFLTIIKSKKNNNTISEDTGGYVCFMLNLPHFTENKLNLRLEFVI